MRHLSTLLSILVVALVGMVVLGRGAVAQDATPVSGPSLVGHPLVGAWSLDTDTEIEDDAPTLAHFTSDGIYVQLDNLGTNGVGSWESTGPSSANLTVLSYDADEEGNFEGGTIVRAEIDVSADGQSFTATYTLEFFGPDGTTTGQYGPGSAAGTRIAVEPMGNPVGTLADLFGPFEEGTPEP